MVGMKKTPTIIANKGLHTHRFKDNPEELAFAEEWDNQNVYGKTLAYLLDPEQGSGCPPKPEKREIVVAATVIQWLGSPVGQGFLRALGYEKVKAK